MQSFSTQGRTAIILNGGNASTEQGGNAVMRSKVIDIVHGSYANIKVGY